MSLEQQIEELRVELRSITDTKELRQIEAELTAAVDALARLGTEAALPG
jgi:predicted  nucleic acid-binding Zn-ribbon protein